VARYRFLTTWLLGAPLADTWRAVQDCERWPDWWRGIEQAEVIARGAAGTGLRVRCAWRSVVPYTVRFETETVRVQPPHVIEVTARGELEGRGVWRLFGSDEATCVTYDWDVETTKAWMNAAAPLARPLFAWNHHWIMRRGGEGLARLLDARLLAAT